MEVYRIKKEREIKEKVKGHCSQKKKRYTKQQLPNFFTAVTNKLIISPPSFTFQHGSLLPMFNLLQLVNPQNTKSFVPLSEKKI